MSIIDQLKTAGALMLSREAQIAMIESFPRAVDFHRALWMKYNTIVEGDYPPDKAQKIADIMLRVQTSLNVAEAAQQDARREINAAIEKAIAAGKLKREDLAGTGLNGLPLIAVAAVLVGLISVWFFGYMTGFNAANDAASKGIGEAMALIGAAAAEQVRAGNDLPPRVAEVLKPQPKPAGPDLVQGGGFAVIGLAALALIMFGGRKR